MRLSSSSESSPDSSGGSRAGVPDRDGRGDMPLSTDGDGETPLLDGVGETPLLVRTGEIPLRDAAAGDMALPDVAGDATLPVDGAGDVPLPCRVARETALPADGAGEYDLLLLASGAGETDLEPEGVAGRERRNGDGTPSSSSSSSMAPEMTGMRICLCSRSRRQALMGSCTWRQIMGFGW